MIALAVGVAPRLATAPVATAVMTSPEAALARAERTWYAQRLDRYAFRLRVSCFCPRTAPATITVDGRRARGATGLERRIDTVPEMFAAIRRTLRDPRAGAVRATYDRRRGFPRSAWIDPVVQAADEEYGFTVDRFRALR